MGGIEGSQNFELGFLSLPYDVSCLPVPLDAFFKTGGRAVEVVLPLQLA